MAKCQGLAVFALSLGLNCAASDRWDGPENPDPLLGGRLCVVGRCVRVSTCIGEF